RNFTAVDYNTPAGGGDSSFNELPALRSIADPHLTDGCGPRGVPLGITHDIDGEPRSATNPQIGADESEGLMNDVSITSVVTPKIPISMGLQDVVVKVKNVGINTISNFDIAYKHNINPPVVKTVLG